MRDQDLPKNPARSGPGRTTPKSDPEQRSQDDSTPAAPARRGFLRRHLILTSVGAIVVVLVLTSTAFAWWANHQLSNIPRVDAGIVVPPGKDHNEGGKPLNILLLGTDNGESKESVAEDLADGAWTPFRHRSDTIMIVHVPADRSSVQLVSIPRDTWVRIEGYPARGGRAKLNAAFAYGGPALARQTVEDFTGIPIDHVALIDWQNFQDLTSALDGVKVYIPEAFTAGPVRWERGWQTLNAERALQYVRTRTNLPGGKEGDFGRIARQQNFLRAVMKDVLSPETTRNPIQFTKVLRSLTQYLTIDSTWDNDEIRDLAWSLRSRRASDVQFATVPLGRYDRTRDGQSIVVPAANKADALFRALEDDRLQDYLDRHPEDQLLGETQVN